MSQWHQWNCLIPYVTTTLGIGAIAGAGIAHQYSKRKPSPLIPLLNRQIERTDESLKINAIAKESYAAQYTVDQETLKKINEYARNIEKEHQDNVSKINELEKAPDYFCKQSLPKPTHERKDLFKKIETELTNLKSNAARNRIQKFVSDLWSHLFLRTEHDYHDCEEVPFMVQHDTWSNTVAYKQYQTCFKLTSPLSHIQTAVTEITTENEQHLKKFEAQENELKTDRQSFVDTINSLKSEESAQEKKSIFAKNVRNGCAMASILATAMSIYYWVKK